MPLDSAAVAELRAIVGDAHVLTDPDLHPAFVVDWTGRFRGHTPAVVRPGTTAEVAAVLATCARRRLPVVPQGGNTGLVGGSVPLSGEVVLSLRRLDGLDPVDGVSGQVTVGAGVTLAAVQAHVRPSGWEFPVDLAARDSATIGGMVATNAGGMHVVAHGPIRAHVRGIEAVRSDGRVISHLGGLVKDNTGYDLAGLLCGSEGTLAVITRVRLGLVPVRAERVTALIGLESMEAAVELASLARRRIPDLISFEVYRAAGRNLVARHFDLPASPIAPTAVEAVVEVGGTEGAAERLAVVLADLDPEAVAVAADARGRARLWAVRELHTEAISTEGVPVKLDVTLPLGALAEFASRVEALVDERWPDLQLVLFGHAGDGNLHVNVVPAPPDPVPLEDAVFRLVASLGGSISAEHGIGVAKLPWLSLCRSPEELATFGDIRRAMDPSGILNPAVLRPVESG